MHCRSVPHTYLLCKTSSLDVLQRLNNSPPHLQGTQSLLCSIQHLGIWTSEALFGTLSQVLSVLEMGRAGLQGKAFPMSVFGLLQHETKLSVVNFTVRKAATFEDPVANKAELLLVTGIRYVQPLKSVN